MSLSPCFGLCNFDLRHRYSTIDLQQIAYAWHYSSILRILHKCFSHKKWVEVWSWLLIHDLWMGPWNAWGLSCAISIGLGPLVHSKLTSCKYFVLYAMCFAENKKYTNYNVYVFTQPIIENITSCTNDAHTTKPQTCLLNAHWNMVTQWGKWPKKLNMTAHAWTRVQT